MKLMSFTNSARITEVFWGFFFFFIKSLCVLKNNLSRFPRCSRKVRDKKKN